MNNKKTLSTVQCWLTVLSVSALLISNVVTAKQMQLPFGITMTCAIFVFPITYILSDVFSECYGYRWSRITCYMGFLMNILMVVVFELAIATKAPDYWKNQEAFSIVLGNTPRVLCASLFAFMVGDFVNDNVFRKMKEKHKGTEGFSVRAIASSVCGEVVDSAIFIPFAFIGQMPTKNLIIMGITQVCLKALYETIILPLTTLAVNRVNEYEQKRTP